MIEARERGRGGSHESERQLVIAEHAVLASRAEQLERLLGRLAQGDGDRFEELDVMTLLEEFRLRFGSHLAREKRGGALDRVRGAEPRFARRIDRLQSEHDELRRRMETLVTRTSGAGWTRLHASFVAFHRRLRAHETAENDVLLCAYLEDLGGRG
jgi:iron-sulfur cluster repair protein YtfE (RIC family)